MAVRWRVTGLTSSLISVSGESRNRRRGIMYPVRRGLITGCWITGQLLRFELIMRRNSQLRDSPETEISDEVRPVTRQRTAMWDADTRFMDVVRSCEILCRADDDGEMLENDADQFRATFRASTQRDTLEVFLLTLCLRNLPLFVSWQPVIHELTHDLISMLPLTDQPRDILCVLQGILSLCNAVSSPRHNLSVEDGESYYGSNLRLRFTQSGRLRRVLLPHIRDDQRLADNCRVPLLRDLAALAYVRARLPAVAAPAAPIEIMDEDTAAPAPAPAAAALRIPAVDTADAVIPLLEPLRPVWMALVRLVEEDQQLPVDIVQVITLPLLVRLVVVLRPQRRALFALMDALLNEGLPHLVVHIVASSAMSGRMIRYLERACRIVGGLSSVMVNVCHNMSFGALIRAAKRASREQLHERALFYVKAAVFGRTKNSLYERDDETDEDEDSDSSVEDDAYDYDFDFESSLMMRADASWLLASGLLEKLDCEHLVRLGQQRFFVTHRDCLLVFAYLAMRTNGPVDAVVTLLSMAYSAQSALEPLLRPIQELMSPFFFVTELMKKGHFIEAELVAFRIAFFVNCFESYELHSSVQHHVPQETRTEHLAVLRQHPDVPLSVLLTNDWSTVEQLRSCMGKPDAVLSVVTELRHTKGRPRYLMPEFMDILNSVPFVLPTDKRRFQDILHGLVVIGEDEHAKHFALHYVQMVKDRPATKSQILSSIRGCIVDIRKAFVDAPAGFDLEGLFVYLTASLGQSQAVLKSLHDSFIRPPTRWPEPERWPHAKQPDVDPFIVATRGLSSLGNATDQQVSPFESWVNRLRMQIDPAFASVVQAAAIYISDDD
eukprot:TRINITY_DN628_c0_g4_i1.p1 TRINITY_DN628_c0_g4~~TRINITY_DN628_c0_g4_i1.p1  ORF type:complete len:835 (+),score=137.99 TRINITY_DN628_c0_g4_i1:337-2841(+)